jgi:hypothetical protein
MVHVVTIEREFGCGASEIARLVASGLGWSLWDERLTQEIARLTESTPEAVERREWRSDPVVYRVIGRRLRPVIWSRTRSGGLVIVWRTCRLRNRSHEPNTWRAAW